MATPVGTGNSQRIELLTKRKVWRTQQMIAELESKAEPTLGHDSSTNN